MQEGTIFFANEPVIEITAPVIEAQVIETFLINSVNMQTVLSTKASRVVHAARGRALVDFAARRTQGRDASNALARVSYMVGFAGTSSVLAGKLYGIPTYGTMAHSFIETFRTEADAFFAYAGTFPDSTTLLVDTYDTLEGVRRAIDVATEMQRRGHALRAVRLDSGDLLDLAVKSRALLDEAGLTGVEVFASGGLDEHDVAALVEAGAPIDGFGVGTKIGVSADAPWTDCAYKLVEYDGRPTLKLSTDKQTLPGAKQVFRVAGGQESYSRDVIALANQARSESREPLLSEAMADGHRTTAPVPLEQLRGTFREQFERLPLAYKALRQPPVYPVERSPELERLLEDASDELRSRNE
jgi:nicotinate phosphoribosyltransferase